MSANATEAVAAIVGTHLGLIAQRLEDEIRPLLEVDKYEGGYACCGCSTYDAILDHAIRIVREARP